MIKNLMGDLGIWDSVYISSRRKEILMNSSFDYEFRIKIWKLFDENFRAFLIDY